MAFKFEGKEMHPIFVFAVLLVNSLQRGKVWQSCTQQTEKSHYPRKLCRFTSTLCSLHALLVHYLYSVFIQHMVWYGTTSETVWMQRRQKYWLKYTDCTRLKKITS